MTQKDPALGYFQRPLPASSVHVTYRQPDLRLHQLLKAATFSRLCRHRRHRRHLQPLHIRPSFRPQTMIEGNDCAPSLDLRNWRERVSASTS